MHYYFMFQIAVLDVDICGPSIPKVMGLEGEQVRFLLQDTVVDVRQFGGGVVVVCVVLTRLLIVHSSDEQGAKKVIFTVCHSGKLKLTSASPNIISTSPKNVLISRLISQFFCNLNSSKNFTCPSGKLITEFTSPIAKSTSPGLSDTTFFARWTRHRRINV